MSTERGSAPILDAARRVGRQALDEDAGKALLEAFGIATPRRVRARDAADGAALAAALRAPLAVKVISPDILHKSDAGGVTLGLAGPDAVAAAITAMAVKPALAAARVEGWLIEEMAGTGVELVIGAVCDAQFGAMVMVGLGGIFVEVMEDVAFRLVPITRADAKAMLDELKGARLIDGARGRAPASREAIIDVLMAVGGLTGLMATHGTEIGELDINPLIVDSERAVAVDARVILTNRAPGLDGRPPSPADDRSILERFRPLFEPQTIAVLGASTTQVAIANTFIRRLKAFGYPGQIFPIHPKATEIEGLVAYPSLGETPEPIDYAYIAIGAERIADAIALGRGRVRFAQVISSGFAEVEGGEDLERALVATARSAGTRVLGPNCLGTYVPRGGLTFPADACKEAGSVGVISQSGGLSTDIVKRGEWRGLRFSGLVTIGNSADVGPVELTEYFLADPATRAIDLYVEDIKDGRAFFDVLRSAPTPKPVVILRGGRSRQGRMAAASHTGALAGDGSAWRALAAQCPVVMVETVDQFIDTLLALQHFTLRPDRPTRAVTLFGNGGGSSVLGTDCFADLGLDVSPFAAPARTRLEALGFPPGTSVANPIDTPVRTLQEQDGLVAGTILDIVYEHANTDAVAMHLNLSAFVGRGSVDPIDNLLKVVADTQAKWPGLAHFALALRTDGSPALDDKRRDYRNRARAANVPVYDEIPAMASALAAVSKLEMQLGMHALRQRTEAGDKR